MRYLIALTPPAGVPFDITYRDLNSTRELRDGDALFLDELYIRVQAVLDPTDAEHDALVICRPDDRD
jgi:hypothetical protein